MTDDDRGRGERQSALTSPQLHRGFLLFVVIGITVLFLVMVRSFFVTMVLAGVFRWDEQARVSPPL